MATKRGGGGGGGPPIAPVNNGISPLASIGAKNPRIGLNFRGDGLRVAVVWEGRECGVFRARRRLGDWRRYLGVCWGTGRWRRR